MSHVEFNGANCVHQTKAPDGSINAIRVMCREIGGLQWIPFWAIHADSPVYRVGDRGKLLVDYNFAFKKGWTD